MAEQEPSSSQPSIQPSIQPSYQVVDRRSSVQSSEHPAPIDGDSTSAPDQSVPDSSTVSPAATEAQSAVHNVAPADSTAVNINDTEIDSEIDTEIDTKIDTKINNESKTSAGSLPDRAAISELLAQFAIQLDARSLATSMIGVFAAHAWRAMGLVPHPLTGEIAIDLPEAQLSIDCVHFLFSKVEKDLPDTERRETQRRLNDLRMNYLDRSRRA